LKSGVRPFESSGDLIKFLYLDFIFESDSGHHSRHVMEPAQSSPPLQSTLRHFKNHMRHALTGPTGFRSIMYRSLLRLVRCIDKNLEYYFSYRWLQFLGFLDRRNLAMSALPAHPVNIMNLHFPNPVGLAAGFDRDGKLAGRLKMAGFGFIEVGTVNVDSETDPDDKLANIVRNLEYSRSLLTNQALLGVSLGSLRKTLDVHTVTDYLQGMEMFWQCSDYIVINLSRPDSSVRSGAAGQADLRELLEWIKKGQTELCEKHGSYIPVIIKAAIEYESRKIWPEALLIANELEYDGLLIAFENWPSSADVVTTVSEISALTDQLPLIVVGGIKSADEVLKLLSAGANLVQCYTLLVEQGPAAMEKMIRKVSLLTDERACH
jgi:dihydroorotate dehydrogenase